MNEFILKSKIWRYPGFGGWHFVSINKALAKKIKLITSGGLRRGWGSVRVLAKLGKSEWKTSIFPDKDGTYLLAIKAEVRKAEGLKMGDTITFKIKLIDF